MSNSIGFDLPTAKKHSKKLVDIGANTIGIIVERSPNDISFIHRQFQEYLAAKSIIEYDIKEARNIIYKYCSEPTWYNTIITFFGLIPRRQERKFNDFYKVILNAQPIPEQNFLKKFLLYEITIDNTNAPTSLTIDNFNSILHDFKYENFVDYKRKYLNIILGGLDNPKVQNNVISFIKSYYPNFYQYSDPRLEALKKNLPKKLSNPMKEFLKLNLYNGNMFQKLDASNIIRNYLSNHDLLFFLKDIIKNECDIEIRAFAINSLISNDVNTCLLEDIIEKDKTTYPLISFFLFKIKVFLEISTNEDLEDFVEVQSKLNFEMEEEIFRTFLNGWPNSVKLKELCLDSLASYTHGKIRSSIAWKILFYRFPQDKDVLDRIMNEIKGNNHPFIGFLDAFHGWDILAKKVIPNKNLIKIVEDWIFQRNLIGPEVAFACLWIKTDRVKEYLIKELGKTNIPHWSVMALYEGWKEDEGVVNELKNYFKSSNKRKSFAAHFIGQIFSDEKNEGIKILEEILFDNNYPFRERAIIALIELDNNYFENNVLSKLLEKEIYSFSKQSIFNSYLTVLRIIAKYYLDKPEVRKLVFSNINVRMEMFDILLKFTSIGQEKIDELLNISLPLDTSLRSSIIEKLGNESIYDEKIFELLKYYDHESDGSIKSHAVINLFKIYKYNGNIEQIMENVRDKVFAVGPDFELQRSLAFVGYLIAERLDDYFSFKDKNDSFANPALLFEDSFSENPVLIKVIVDNFEYIYKSLKGDLNRLSYSNVDEQKIWAYLSKYIDYNSQAYSYLIEYIENRLDIVKDSRILRFLEKKSPQSNVLKALSLDCLKNDRDHVIKSYAGWIIGNYFNYDENIRDYLINVKDPYEEPGKIIALSLGWPKEPILQTIYHDMKYNQRPITNSAGFYLKFLYQDNAEVLEFLNYVIYNYQKAYKDHKYFFMPLLQRIKNDDNVIKKLKEYILISNNVNIKISYYSLLKLTGFIDKEINDWKRNEIKTLNPRGHGYDIVKNKVIPIRNILYEETLWDSQIKQ